MKILLRYQREENWSEDNDAYDERYVTKLEELEKLMDPSSNSSVVKVQVFRQFNGQYYYILATIVTPKNQELEGKWLFHTTIREDCKNIMIVANINAIV